MILQLHFRLHEAGAQNVSNYQSKESQKKRLRRHQVRKILMVLDYIIDVVAGTFILFLLFIGENKVSYSLLYQRILFCFGTLLYGILIPIAHLLNESRVRNIIVKDGWLKGFISIFHSEKQIRQFQRKQNIQMRWKTFCIDYACHDIKVEKFLRYCEN